MHIKLEIDKIALRIGVCFHLFIINREGEGRERERKKEKIH